MDENYYIDEVKTGGSNKKEMAPRYNCGEIVEVSRPHPPLNEEKMKRVVQGGQAQQSILPIKIMSSHSIDKLNIFYSALSGINNQYK